MSDTYKPDHGKFKKISTPRLGIRSAVRSQVKFESEIDPPATKVKPKTGRQEAHNN